MTTLPPFDDVFRFSAVALFVLHSTFAHGLKKDFQDVSQILGVHVDLRYASTDNFMGEDLYQELRTAFLHKTAAKKLEKAALLLQNRKPGWKLLVFDGLRPRDVQQRLWDRVKGTEKQIYVADPQKGSVHNYGFAVDLSLQDEQGKEVDMGTPFDSFEPLAQPKLEERFLREGKLSPAHVDHRRLLRDVMESAGFKQFTLEWWHFDALPKEEVKAHYPIVETLESTTK